MRERKILYRQYFSLFIFVFFSMILCAFCLWEIHWETTRDVSHRFFLSLEETSGRPSGNQAGSHVGRIKPALFEPKPCGVYLSVFLYRGDAPPVDPPCWIRVDRVFESGRYVPVDSLLTHRSSPAAASARIPAANIRIAVLFMRRTARVMSSGSTGLPPSPISAL